MHQSGWTEMFDDIWISGNWKTAKKISKGWSSDIKYYIETANSKPLLLRVSDIELYDAKKKEYEIISKYSCLGFPMSQPIDSGTCNSGKNVYILLAWVEGKDLEEALPGLPETEQYRLGREAGLILKRIHLIALDKSDIPVRSKKEKKLLQLARYEESNLRIAGDETVIHFVKENIDLIWKRKPVYHHGDYHPGNLVYTKIKPLGSLILTAS
jgi:aminoglycoside phosphotransferase (APT) family kinase protein